jgi:hypothetical protein
MRHYGTAYRCCRGVVEIFTDVFTITFTVHPTRWTMFRITVSVSLCTRAELHCSKPITNRIQSAVYVIVHMVIVCRRLSLSKMQESLPRWAGCGVLNFALDAV